MDTAVYAGLAGMAKDRKVRTVLAAHNELLEKGLLAGPYAAIASLRDLERLAGKRMNANKRICAEAQKILQKWGTKYLCIDAGERMLMVSREGAFWRNAKNKRDWQRPGTAPLRDWRMECR